MPSTRSPVNSLIRIMIFIPGLVLFAVSLYLFAVLAVTRDAIGKFQINDPWMLILGMAFLIASVILMNYAIRFDESNARYYQQYLIYRENEDLPASRKKKVVRIFGLYDDLFLWAISKAGMYENPDTARFLVCLIYFLNTLLLLPLLVSIVMGVVILILIVSHAYGIVGLACLLLILILVIYALRFSQVNRYIAGLDQMYHRPGTLDDKEKDRVHRYSLAIGLSILAIGLLLLISGRFSLPGENVVDPRTTDYILGRWTPVEAAYEGSNITFDSNGNFSWKDPIFGSKNFKGTWINTGNKTHRTYSLLYIDPETSESRQKNFTFVRGYYHAYGEIVFTYPYFTFDGVDGVHFQNPFIINNDHVSIKETPTVMPQPHIPEPGRDVIIGAWRKDSMKQFDWYWVFNENGTYYSINGGILDGTGTWVNISEFRYKVVLQDGGGRYVGYRNCTIFNEHSPDGTFSWIGNSPVLPF